MQETKNNLNSRVRRWRFRFSLRLFLVALTLIAIGIGWWSHRAHQQRQAVAKLREFGAYVYYDYQYLNGKPTRDQPGTFQGDALPNWLVRGFGVDYFYSVVDVDMTYDPHYLTARFVNCQTTEWCDALKGLPRLIKLTVMDSQVDASVLEEVGQLKELEELTILGRGTDALFSNLPVTPNPKVEDVGIRNLRNARNLRQVTVLWCDLHDNSLFSFSSLPRLEYLNVHGKFSEKAVQNLSDKFPNANISATSQPRLPVD